MKHRGDIDAILEQYRTKKARRRKKSQKPLDEAELEAAEGSGAAAEDDGSGGSTGYFPYKPYCGGCGKDLTTVTAYDDDTTELTYTCSACGVLARPSCSASSTAASWSGRSTGRCAGRTRA